MGSPVALVLIDTRPPQLHAWAERGCATVQLNKTSGVSFSTLTYFMNLEYARAHRYDLLFYAAAANESLALPCPDGATCVAGCRHVRWGARHPSYCKLAGLADALSRGYDWVVYLDSDAFLANMSLPLPALLRTYGASAAAAAGEEGAAEQAFFGWDWPYTLGPNMGFIAMRNTAHTRRMLYTWWNLFAGPYSMKHPMEQHTMQWQIMHLDAFRSRIQTLSLHTMDPSVSDAVVHLDHNAGTKSRTWIGARAIAHVLCTRRAAPCTPHLAAALAALRAPRAGVPTARRLALLRTTLRAACADLSSPPPSPPPPLAPSAALPPLAASALVHFDATAAAAALLRRDPSPAAPSPLLGLPLHIANCSSAPPLAAAQAWRLSVSSRDADAAAACAGLCQLYQLRLAAPPRLCLSLGASRAPRQPYSALAQLHHCAPPARLKGRRRGAHLVRARLHFDSASGRIKTTHKLKDLKRELPEQRVDCGFWSSCSNTKTVLGKPCWLQLRDNPDACGSSEPAIQNILQRAKDPHTRPGYANITLGPAGPAPWPVLAMPGAAHLCLRSWRGGFHERNALSFHQCPQERTRGLHRWASALLYAWELRAVADGAAVASGYPLEERLVTIRPKQAAHMCVTAPPLHVDTTADPSPPREKRARGGE
ncbi:hypothetical protein AB1Y20_003469 [Prymnesium parvum]|uniref:Nucleotide-diphospho-sugar transferase domain-containing protein n=1 Tax=Prymnesium parvum TaxID=97485 RepID=A0AB34JBS5_PRYPA